jgi:hypothetical protein
MVEKLTSEQLEAVVNVRLTTTEKVRLKEEADLAGLTISALGRRRFFSRSVTANADEVMIKELRRLGGLLKHIHNESHGVYSHETGAILLEIKTYIEKLTK